MEDITTAFKIIKQEQDKAVNLQCSLFSDYTKIKIAKIRMRHAIDQAEAERIEEDISKLLHERWNIHSFFQTNNKERLFAKLFLSWSIYIKKFVIK